MKPQPGEEMMAEVEMYEGPGKFESEPAYAPHYWDLVLEGAADVELYDDLSRPVAFFEVTAGDREMFPYIARDTAWISLLEDDQGFVWTEELTQNSFEGLRDSYEKLAEERTGEEFYV